MVQRWDLSPCRFQDTECLFVCRYPGAGDHNGGGGGGIPPSNLAIHMHIAHVFLNRTNRKLVQLHLVSDAFKVKLLWWMVKILLDQHEHWDAFKSN